MKTYKHLLLPLLLVLSYCSSPTHNHNPYGLDIINNMKDYKKGVKENPNNELIDISEQIPSILLDVKYATEDNFVGQAVYSSGKAYARKPVVDALADIQEELQAEGMGLKIFDAYRPYAVTVKFYEIVQDTVAVAAPWEGSRHNRGCAVDLTLIDLKTFEELAMPTPFDVVNDYSHVECTDLSDEIIKNREKLISIMQKHGFSVYPYEWWHYDFNGWDAFKLMDIPFEELNK